MIEKVIEMDTKKVTNIAVPRKSDRDGYKVYNYIIYKKPGYKVYNRENTRKYSWRDPKRKSPTEKNR